jgi:hypothetical protein
MKERHREMERRKKMEDQMDSFKKANEDLKLMQLEEQKKEVEKQKKIEEYA